MTTNAVLHGVSGGSFAMKVLTLILIGLTIMVNFTITAQPMPIVPPSQLAQDVLISTGAGFLLLFVGENTIVVSLCTGAGFPVPTNGQQDSVRQK